MIVHRMELSLCYPHPPSYGWSLALTLTLLGIANLILRFEELLNLKIPSLYLKAVGVRAPP